MTFPPGPPPQQPGGPVPPPWPPLTPAAGPGGYPAPGYPNPGPPGYPAPGYPPPGYPWGPAPGPTRPSAKKLLIAAALLLATAVIAGAVAAWLMTALFGAQPSASDQFPSATPTSVAFEAGETKVIYADSPGSSFRVTCRGEDAAADTDLVTIEPVDGEVTVNNWLAGFSVTAHQSGVYTFSCKGPPGTTFGFGGPASVGRIGAPVALILLAAATGLAGVITGIIGLVRRRRQVG